MEASQFPGKKTSAAFADSFELLKAIYQVQLPFLASCRTLLPVTFTNSLIPLILLFLHKFKLFYDIFNTPEFRFR